MNLQSCRLPLLNITTQFQIRGLLSGANTTGAVKLSFDKYDAKREQSAAPIIIQHGLFGSRQNWRAISKRLNADLNPYRTVYAVDTRNHGLSPRQPDHSYDLMAEDLKEMYRHLGISKAVVMGHSMGGRTTINFALKYPELVDKAIIVDISQYSAMQKASKEISEMLQIIRDLKVDSNLSLSEGRKLVSEQLVRTGLPKPYIDFQLLNFIKNAENSFEWRINVEGLYANLPTVMSYPEKNLNKKFVGDVLFIAGANSSYIEKKDIAKIKINFPTAQFEFIERAGHLVHLDQPAKFLEVVTRFINAK